MLLATAGCATPPPALDGFETVEIEVGARSMSVAVADTPSRRGQGLRGVEDLPPGLDGMLFVFGGPRSATFGMRDTLMPLDIWWFDREGHLVGSTEMEPCAAALCPDYPSPGEVAWALETPQGEIEFESGATLVVADS